MSKKFNFRGHVNKVMEEVFRIIHAGVAKNLEEMRAMDFGKLCADPVNENARAAVHLLANINKLDEELDGPKALKALIANFVYMSYLLDEVQQGFKSYASTEEERDERAEQLDLLWDASQMRDT